jgi:Ca2+-binding EF-hand superfamily protein
VNKKVLVDLFKEEDAAKSEVITPEQFFSTLEGIAAPLDSDIKVKLLATYDKKGEGKVNYTDFITEQKFVHAVRLKILCVVCGMV